MHGSDLAGFLAAQMTLLVAGSLYSDTYEDPCSVHSEVVEAPMYFHHSYPASPLYQLNDSDSGSGSGSGSDPDSGFADSVDLLNSCCFLRSHLVL